MKQHKKTSKWKNIFLPIWRHLRLSFTIIMVFIILLTSLTLMPLFSNTSIVSEDDLRNYIEVYVSEYRRLVEENIALLNEGSVGGYSHSGSQNFTFYWSNPNQIKGVVSQSHGVAIFFNHTEGTSKITVESITDPIEYFLWPQMIKWGETEELPSVRILKGVYHLDSQITINYGLLYADPGAILRYTGEGRAFNVSGSGCVIIFGCLIEKNKMILKGSNNKKDWSSLQARFDALSIFLWDCIGILNETQIKTIEVEYKFVLLLERVGSRISSREYVETPALFNQDYSDLVEIGASNETLNRILNDYLNMQESQPMGWLESIWAFIMNNIILIIVGVIIGVGSNIATELIKKKYIQKKSKNRKKKR